jgi:DNA-binding HxlR family transcriptional regulator
VTKRGGYGQYCGFARALELIGERWAMLVIRDLLVGPKRFSDLHRGLPKIPSNILTARLKELEENGIVQRRAAPRPGSGVVYELTGEGRELEDAVVALGQWGAKRLGELRDGEIVTEDSLAMALRTTFRPNEAKNDTIGYELRIGDIVFHANVDRGTITVGRGPLESPDIVIEAGPAIRELMAREVTPQEALKRGIVKIQGPRKLLDRFAATFQI